MSRLHEKFPEHDIFIQQTKLKNTLDFKSRATDFQEENQTGWGGSEDEMHKAAGLAAAPRMLQVL